MTVVYASGSDPSLVIAFFAARRIMDNDLKPEADDLPAFPVEQTPAGEAAPVGIEELIRQIKETADKLLRDQASRGDVKLLSTALRELRYCFKVFAPLRSIRKVTVFGSARTKP